MTPVVVETSASGTRTTPNVSASVEHSTEGRGKLIAVLVLPLVLVVLAIAGFWAFSLGTSDEENDRQAKPASSSTQDTHPAAQDMQGK
jgi:flagellar basal body-associated protein FliL